MRSIVWFFAVTLVVVASGCNPSVPTAPAADPGSAAPAAAASAPAPAPPVGAAAAAAADPAAPPSSFAALPPVGTQARCPVMGDVFAVAENSLHSEYQGRTYVFCCPGCKGKFDADPARWAAAATAPGSGTPAPVPAQP